MVPFDMATDLGEGSTLITRRPELPAAPGVNHLILPLQRSLAATELHFSGADSAPWSPVVSAQIPLNPCWPPAIACQRNLNLAKFP